MTATPSTLCIMGALLNECRPCLSTIERLIFIELVLSFSLNEAASLHKAPLIHLHGVTVFEKRQSTAGGKIMVNRNKKNMLHDYS